MAVDRLFSGTEENYRIPSPITLQEEGWEFLAEPPPRLPGYSPDRMIHPARGSDEMSLFLSKNIQSDDPLYLRLAYMPYPLAQNLRAFLLDLLPWRLYDDKMVPRSWWDAEQSLIKIENQFYYKQTTNLDRETSDTVNSFIIEGFFDNSLMEAWGRYQHLAILVLWIWGGVGKCPAYFALEVAEAVHHLFQATRHFQTVLRAKEWGEEIDLEGMQDRARAGVPHIRYRQEPLSLALLADGLMEVINTAGTKLGHCAACQRLFLLQNARQRFCCNTCRQAGFHRKISQNHTKTIPL